MNTMTTEKQRIVEYIRKVGGRKVYISELAEELQIDFDVIEEVMIQLKEEEQ